MIVRKLFYLFVITLLAVPSCLGATEDDAKSLGTKPKGPRVVMRTPFGRIILRLLPDVAPQAAAAVLKLAEQRGCQGGACKFYRNEGRPNSKYGEPPEGPPYSLLQGSFALDSAPLTEGNVMVRAGHVAFIPGVADFFIALADHSEWGTAHTVFAEIEDFSAVDLITIQKYEEQIHPEHGTVMRMLVRQVPFEIDTDIEELNPLMTPVP